MKQKKTYSAPAIKSEAIKVGVFGNYPPVTFPPSGVIQLPNGYSPPPCQ
jgi:hypothetical protein